MCDLVRQTKVHTSITISYQRMHYLPKIKLYAPNDSHLPSAEHRTEMKRMNKKTTTTTKCSVRLHDRNSTQTTDQPTTKRNPTTTTTTVNKM